MSQIVRPFWRRRRERWGWVREGDQVRLFWFVVAVMGGLEEGGGLGVEVGSGAVEVDMFRCEGRWSGGSSSWRSCHIQFMVLLIFGVDLIE